MCGIIGYTGKNKAVPVLAEGLATLEYRGYDSAGIAVCDPAYGIIAVKTKGRLSVLEEKLKNGREIAATCGIGHTRWATHGKPSDENSHPHTAPSLALVHNGIIENYAEIGEMLRGAGYEFESETDTESAAKLIDMLYRKYKSPLGAISKAAKIIRGSYAFGIIFRDFPGKIFAVRKDSPLIAACGEDGCFIASDIPAVLKYTNRYYRMEEGIIAVVAEDGVSFFDAEEKSVPQTLEEVDWSVEQAQKGGFPHFMIKEIHEEPDALRKTLEAGLKDGLPHFGTETLDGDFLSRFGNIHIVACGTAMHAGLVGKVVIEKFARVPVSVEIASEFRYRDPILDAGDLVVLLSQSGETADTLAALRHAKKCGVHTLAIVNVIGSSVAREADTVLYTRAGPEIAVASTKAYSVQCAVLYLLAFRIALARGKMSESDARELCGAMLREIPDAVKKVLDAEKSVMGIAKKLIRAEHAFYIGRNIDWQICIEASLKLKEISYIHSEAYAAGELKHGTISLVTEGVPVIALSTAEAVCEKTVSGIREVKARGAHVLLVSTEALALKYGIPYDDLIAIPDTREIFLLFPAVTVMQLLAYHVSDFKGIDVDKPRNLAKSVTVE